jgi:hypothetical protein
MDYGGIQCNLDFFKIQNKYEDVSIGPKTSYIRVRKDADIEHTVWIRDTILM